MSLDPALIHAYWSALTGDTAPLPEIAEDPVAAFLALLDNAGDHSAGFRRTPQPISDPYPAIALAEDSSGAMEAWAMEIAGLVPFSCPALPDYVFFLDTVADRDGNHRIYPFVDGEPAEEMASLEEALRWMTVVVLHATHRVELEAVEAVDAALVTANAWLWSGAALFCQLRSLPLPDAYRAWSQRTWPRFELNTTEEASANEVGVARIAMLATVENLLRNPRVGIRVRSGQIAEAHRALLEHLKDLAAAVVGDRPPKLIVEASTGDDPHLAERAAQWLARFEEAGGESVQDASTMIRRAVGSAVDELVASEAIEVAEGGRAALVEELSLAAFEATNPKQLLRKLRSALFRSEHCDDVFADDLSLDEVFRRALGG